MIFQRMWNYKSLEFIVSMLYAFSDEWHLMWSQTTNKSISGT